MTSLGHVHPDPSSLPIRSPRAGAQAIRWGGGVLIVMAAACLLTLPWSMERLNKQNLDATFIAPLQSVTTEADPAPQRWLLGTDRLGRSMLARVLNGGAVSLGVGLAAAAIATLIGTTWGMVAGYLGGRCDAVMMRIVDILYGLPYILLVVLLDLALEPLLTGLWGSGPGNILTLLLAIGAVSWLTLARVVRGQVLSLRAQPFVEAARACGLPTWRILFAHILPNLVGPIVVYTTLIVPQAILQESFLSFLGIGIRPPLPSWGNLAAAGLGELNLVASHWWLLAWPCLILAATLLAMNALGEGLRRRFDPRHIGG